MKKLTPFIFPAIVLVIVLFLLYRWYQARTSDVDTQLSFGEGIEIEDLSGEQLQSVLGGNDVKTLPLEAESGEDPSTQGTGTIRYEVVDGKVAFSVMTQLETLAEGEYQVWLRDPETQEAKKAFVLQPGKGGLLGSAAVTVDLLPFEVIVTKQSATSTQMGEVVLKAMLEKPDEEEAAGESATDSAGIR